MSDHTPVQAAGGTRRHHPLYNPRTPWGHVVSMVAELPTRGGVALDLGCGVGAVAEPLAELGFEYVGIEIDPVHVADLRSRGFEAHEMDLWGVDDRPLAKALGEILAEREVTLVLLLDVIEHSPDTEALLADLQEAVAKLDRPLMVVSIPNIAHVDVAAKLLAGEFTYTPTGLLDRTHVQLWTHHRLTADLGRYGWLQVAERDFSVLRSDQYESGHPIQAEHTPLGAWVRQLRERVDDYAYVNQFIRAFTLAPAPLQAAARPPGEPAAFPEPFLSVVVRTQGDRPMGLREALLCLAAQTDDDFEVELLVHHPDEARVRAVRELVGEFHSHLVARVRVQQVLGGGRARPLNVGLGNARGRYVAFLDDDDLVTADWVEVFRRGADSQPGRVVRSVCLQQDVSWSPGVGSGYSVRSGFRDPYATRFDFIHHLVMNQTPIHAFAVPRQTVQVLGLSFDDSLPVLEDWDFLLHVVPLTGVVDTEEVTGIYHWWVERCDADRAAPLQVWHGIRQLVLDRLMRQPLLLPADATRQLVEWAEENVTNREALVVAESRLAATTAGLAAVERSRVWRATKPLRSGLTAGRKVTRAGLRRWPGRPPSLGRGASG